MYLGKLMIVVIMILSFTILYYLIRERINLLRKKRELESFTTLNDEQKNIAESHVSPLIQSEHGFTASNVKRIDGAAALNQLCIKSSYNTAYTGKIICLEMIRYVLSRGVRVLDFAVFYVTPSAAVSEPQACVGFSPDQDAPIPTVGNDVLPTLADVLETALDGAFFKSQSDMGFSTPNPDDPLIIHIRMQTDKESRVQLFDMIQRTIGEFQTREQYRQYFPMAIGCNDLTGTSTLVGRQVYFLFADIVDADGAFFDDAKCSEVAIINGVTSTDSQSLLHIGGIESSRDVVNISIPKSAIGNNDEMDKRVNIQFMKFYSADAQLTKYEEMFALQPGGIMLKSFLDTMMTD